MFENGRLTVIGWLVFAIIVAALIGYATQQPLCNYGFTGCS